MGEDRSRKTVLFGGRFKDPSPPSPIGHRVGGWTALLEYNKHVAAIAAEPPERERKTIAQIVEEIWQNWDREYNNTRVRVKRLQRIDKEMSSEARELFGAYVPDGDLARNAAQLPSRLQGAFTDAMKLLRDPAFQPLLVSYPRPQRVFLVAYETEDTVSSKRLIRDQAGNEYNPANRWRPRRRLLALLSGPAPRTSRSSARRAGERECGTWQGGERW